MTLTPSHATTRAVADRLYAALDGYCDAVSITTLAGHVTINVTAANDFDRDEIVSTVEAVLDDLGSITASSGRVVAGFLDDVSVVVDGRRELSYIGGIA